MRLSWRTQQFRAADRQDTTAALGMPEPWIHRAAVTGHLLLVLLVAVVLRIRGLDRYSLWYDEVVTMRLARTANPTALIRLLDQIDGTRAPLHPLILQGWLCLFGTSDLAGRSFSAACGIITVLVAYRLGQGLVHGRLSALGLLLPGSQDVRLAGRAELFFVAGVRGVPPRREFAFQGRLLAAPDRTGVQPSLGVLHGRGAWAGLF